MADISKQPREGENRKPVGSHQQGEVAHRLREEIHELTPEQKQVAAEAMAKLGKELQNLSSALLSGSKAFQLPLTAEVNSQELAKKLLADKSPEAREKLIKDYQQFVTSNQKALEQISKQV